MDFGMSRFVAAAALAVGVLATGTGAAHAAAAAFCDKDSPTCVTAYVENKAAVTIESVTIDQEKGKNGTCTPETKKVTRDLATSTSEGLGYRYPVLVDNTCEYKFTFNTSDGCKGDKVVHLRKKHFDENRLRVNIKGGCGTLDATIGARTVGDGS